MPAYSHFQIVLSQDTIITAGGASYLAAPQDFYAASDGSLSVSLQATNDLTPNGTYYSITQFAVGTDFTNTFQVPQTAGPFVITTLYTAALAASPSPGRVSTLLVDAAATFTAGPITLPAASIADAALSSNVALKNAGNAFTAANTFAVGQIQSVGTGDLLNYGTTMNSVAQLLDIRSGTQASPDTSIAPLIKVSRTISLTEGQVLGDGSNRAATAAFYATTPVGGAVQPVGVLGFSETYSTDATNLHGAADATAVYGVGISRAGSTHCGIGVFGLARVDSTVGSASNQFAVQNGSGTDHSVNATGASKTVILLLAPTGLNQSAAGIQIDNAFGYQVDVGLHFNGHVVGGKTGPTFTADIQSDSTALNGVLINGTHATAAIAVKAGAGPILIGETAALSASSLLEVISPNGTSKDPLFRAGSGGATDSFTMRLVNGAGTLYYAFISGGAGLFLTGTAAGDSGVKVATAGKAYHIGGTAKVVTVNGNDQLGFFAATPTAQIAGATDVLAGLVTLGLRAASANPPLNLGTGTLTAGGLALPAGSVPDSLIATDTWMPADYAFKTWAFDPVVGTGVSQALTPAGTVFLIKLHLREAATITNLVMWLSVIGNTLTAGQCFAALYDSSKNLKSTTADQSVRWVGALGNCTMALGSAQAMAAGDCYIALFYNGTTGPAFLRGVSSNSVNIGLAAANSRYATADTGQTTAMPGTLGTFTGANANYWAALS